MASTMSSPLPVAPAVTMPTQPSTSESNKENQATAPAKAPRKRKTAEEKAAEEQARAEKRQKKAAEEQERAEKRQKQQEAKAERDALKAARDAEKQQKLDEEKRRKDKEEKAQPKLFAFLKPKAVTPSQPTAPIEQSTAPDGASTDVEPKTCAPEADKQQPQQNEYKRLFKDFYVKSDVTMASPPFEMTEETKEVKSRILDEHVYHKRDEVKPIPFDPVATFQLSGIPTKRGIPQSSVSDIMKKIWGDSLSDTPDVQSTTETQVSLSTGPRELLAHIPMKMLSFYEDVRPSYVGTATSQPAQTLFQLARNPTGKLIRKVDYDYDSELEWMEDDGDDAENDEDDEDDDEEEGVEADGDDQAFVDDTDDTSPTRQLLLGDGKPISTGLCFEDQNGVSSCAETYKYQMEFLIDLGSGSQIDPFSTSYWKPIMTQATAKMPPPPTPGDVIAKLIQKEPAYRAADLVPELYIEEFKLAIISDDASFFTKQGLVEKLTKRFEDVCTQKQVRTTIERVAARVQKPGGRKGQKIWVLTQPLLSPPKTS